MGAVAKVVDRRPHKRGIGSLDTHQVKAVKYKIDTCHFLAWRLALIGLVCSVSQ